MPSQSEPLRKKLKADSLAHLKKYPNESEEKHKNLIWRFAEMLVNVPPIAQARFVNEVYAEWRNSPK
jgi:F420-0:gamma-glutamyl ligase-like protein